MVMDIHHKHLPGSRNRSTSFSSSLLDSIDRSIGDDDARTEKAARRRPMDDEFEHLREELLTFRRSISAERPPQSRRSGANRGAPSDFDFEVTGAADHRRPKPIRTEKKKTKKVTEMKKPQSGSEERMIVAVSPLGYGCYAQKQRSTEKPIQSRPSSSEQQPPLKAEREGRFKRTKSKAMKMYGDMKRLNQQPTSPGARIANFLNSLFHTGDSKKSPKPSSVDPMPSRPKPPKLSFYLSSPSSSTSTCSLSSMPDLRSLSQQSKASTASSSSLSTMDQKANASTTTTTSSSSSSSSASSFTRSCLRNSRQGYGFGGGGRAKRCVRFSPVSEIIDDDFGSCASRSSLRNSRYESDPGLMPTPILRTRNRGAEVEGSTAAVRNHGLGPRNNNQKKKDRRHQDRCGEDGEAMDEDAMSFSSSDLFELDFLIGLERYREELPVYETTSLHTNHAIATAFHR